MPMHHGYPEARARLDSPDSRLVNTFDEYQTSDGFVSLADTTGDILRFAGTPDSIEVFVELNDAVVIFARRGIAEEEEITLRSGQSHEPRVRADLVRGRNATAGLTARVQVVGRWLRRDGLGLLGPTPTPPAPSPP